MKISDLSRYPISAAIAAAMLAGCSGSPSLTGAQGALIRAAASKTFRYTGHGQTFEVPAVERPRSKFLADGASGSGSAGGYGSESSGGAGGSVKATIPVTPGEKLAIYVGGQGATEGGFNGGGTGGSTSGSGGNGGSGGGASDVRQGGDHLADRVVVAGGGGGGGGPSIFYGTGDGGLAGGGVGGGDCYRAAPMAAAAGRLRAPRSGGIGGDRYDYHPGNPGAPGKRGHGGDGGSGPGSGSGGGGSGGGAGGGYYGGGGGGAGSRSTSGVGGGGAGGGGSSYVEPTAMHVKNRHGAAPLGDGQVVISW